MKTLSSRNHVTIVFGEWFDKTYGNTYYDALVQIDDHSIQIPYQYGYNAGDTQSIDEALLCAGYRLRSNKRDPSRPYQNIHVACKDKLKRELYKELKL